MPTAAPDPARPTKCPLPMLLANKDAPTCGETDRLYVGDKFWAPPCLPLTPFTPRSREDRGEGRRPGYPQRNWHLLFELEKTPPQDSFPLIVNQHNEHANLSCLQCELCLLGLCSTDAASLGARGLPGRTRPPGQKDVGGSAAHENQEACYPSFASKVAKQRAGLG